MAKTIKPSRVASDVRRISNYPTKTTTTTVRNTPNKASTVITKESVNGRGRGVSTATVRPGRTIAATPAIARNAERAVKASSGRRKAVTTTRTSQHPPLRSARNRTR